MGEILGIGCTHTGVMGPIERMADIYLRQNLKSDLTPAHMKDPANWPAQMREEWADDEGLETARAYRANLVEGFRAARQAIDNFRPDFVAIFGDDQYENFKEDLIPPFCVMAIDEQVCGPRARGPMFTGGPGQEPLTVKGSKEIGTQIARGLIDAGFDVSCSWKLHHEQTYGHAFVNTVRFLDLDGKGFEHRVIPISVNCYGSDLRVPNSENPDPARIGRRLENQPVQPPPGPPPWRCYDLGKQLAQLIVESPWRAVVIGSSSWSHASLTTKNHYLWPDVLTDRQRLAAVMSGDLSAWRDLTTEQLHDAGQHEFLNWVCLAGAMEGHAPACIWYSEAHIFNSDRAVVIFPPHPSGPLQFRTNRPALLVPSPPAGEG